VRSQRLRDGTSVAPGFGRHLSTGQLGCAGQSSGVGARATYLFSVDDTPFPLEPDRVSDDRRYPGYCLMGRIGDSGTPFYVGSWFQCVAVRRTEIRAVVAGHQRSGAATQYEGVSLPDCVGLSRPTRSTAAEDRIADASGSQASSRCSGEPAPSAAGQTLGTGAAGRSGCQRRDRLRGWLAPGCRHRRHRYAGPEPPASRYPPLLCV